MVIDRSGCALMFCYFNDRAAFEGYLEHYGHVDVVVIAGPAPGGDVHCDPAPMDDVMGDEWRRVAVVKTGGDRGHLAAVYSKR